MFFGVLLIVLGNIRGCWSRGVYVSGIRAGNVMLQFRCVQIGFRFFLRVWRGRKRRFVLFSDAEESESKLRIGWDTFEDRAIRDSRLALHCAHVLGTKRKV